MNTNDCRKEFTYDAVKSNCMPFCFLFRILDIGTIHYKVEDLLQRKNSGNSKSEIIKVQKNLS